VLAHPTKSKVFAKSVVAEYNKMKKFQVFEPVLKTDVPVGSKILSSTWVIKQKASGDVHGRLVARGYEQIDGVHYDSSSKAAPVVIDTTIRIVLILCCLARWRADVEDVVGAFLNGEFEANLPPIYMKVPQGFEQFYDGHKFVLRVKKTIYGTIQAAMCFWRVLTKAFSNMGYTRCVTDPCLHFKWTDAGLSLFASHVDDNLIVGCDDNVKLAKRLLQDKLDCEDIGQLKEYLGCKIDYDRTKGRMQITQPVLLQSFINELIFQTAQFRAHQQFLEAR
jgi:hypothetical protein